jgi:hypothetical protein
MHNEIDFDTPEFKSLLKWECEKQHVFCQQKIMLNYIFLLLKQQKETYTYKQT